MSVKFVHLALLVGTFLAAPKPEESPNLRAAKEFLATLDAKEIENVVYPLGSEERTKWAYVPGERKGISWGEMNGVQKVAAAKLLQSSLSTEGYTKAEATRLNEQFLFEIENSNPTRDSNRYWFVFFGQPEANTPWVWRYEGHHLSLTFGTKKGKVTSSTPQFVGSNPAEVKSGPKKGQRLLAAEQDLGFRLVESLTPAQASKAILSSTAPGDIVTSSSRKAFIEGNLGLSFNDMNADQKKLLLQLLDVHSNMQTKSEQARRLGTVKREGHQNIVFAWMGPIERKSRHYYRIQGKSFIVEYDNTQPDGNHIHTVWRDIKNDFGGDVLAEHYSHGHHHK